MGDTTIKRYRKFLRTLKSYMVSNLADHATYIGINRNVGLAGQELKMIKKTKNGWFKFRGKGKADRTDAEILLEKTNEVTNSYRY